MHNCNMTIIKRHVKGIDIQFWHTLLSKISKVYINRKYKCVWIEKKPVWYDVLLKKVCQIDRRSGRGLMDSKRDRIGSPRILFWANTLGKIGVKYILVPGFAIDHAWRCEFN